MKLVTVILRSFTQLFTFFCAKCPKLPELIRNFDIFSERDKKTFLYVEMGCFTFI